MDGQDRPGEGSLLAQGIEEAAERRARSRDLSPLRQLWPLLLRHWPDAVRAAAFLLLSTVATLGMTWAARLVVDQGLGSRSDAQLNGAFAVLCGVALTLAVAAALRFYFVTRLGERVVADLRKKVYGHILTLDPTYFIQVRTGEVLSRLTTDLAIVENLVGSSISFALRNTLSAIGGLAFMIYVAPNLTAAVLIIVLLVLAPMFLIGRRVRRLSTQAQDLFAGAVAYAGESLDGLETVQVFGRERTASERFGAAVEAAFAMSRRRIGMRSLLTFTVMALVSLGLAFVLWTGAHAVGRGEMTWGVLLQFAILSVLAAGAVGALGEVWGDVQKAAGAMERISELLAAKPAIAAPAVPTRLPSPPRGEIELRGVNFCYPGRPDLPALRDFSLKVRPGERVALVGPSGAGKSTVFRLLLRFYDPQSGQVLIDGVDLREADPAEARARLALVAQDTALFSDSALDNILFGREGTTPEQAHAAAQAAQASGFISALPESFDTPLGVGGKTLSGGQRQRLAIARALVRDAPILLLDEATSALDSENERLVQQALHQAMSGRTSLVIAHRLATVLEADRIVVMDEGRVVEQGDHAQLFARGGLYAKLAKLQFSGVEGA